jgi:hypothetical protein
MVSVPKPFRKVKLARWYFRISRGKLYQEVTEGSIPAPRERKVEDMDPSVILEVPINMAVNRDKLILNLTVDSLVAVVHFY